MQPQPQQQPLLQFTTEPPAHLQPGILAMRTLQPTHKDCTLMIDAWTRLQISEVCKYVAVWNLPVSLYGEYNRLPGILGDLCGGILFPWLRKLFLRGNNIESIEVIAHLRMPSLQTLWLGGNKIACLAPLRRAQLLQLKSLTICVNCIQQLTILAELNCRELSSLDLERNEDQNNAFPLASLAKLETEVEGFRIWGLKDGRMRELKIVKALGRKLRNLQTHFPL